MIKILAIAAFLVLSFHQAQAQEFIYDNLPAGQTSNEIFFTGKWCAVNTTPFYGTKSLQNCGKPQPAEYFYSPNLSNGIYNVYARWVANKKFDALASVSITSSDYFFDVNSGMTTTSYSTAELSLDQRVNGNTWVFVGRFTSVGGPSSLVVKFSNLNGDLNTDGMRFVKLADYPPPCDPNTGVGCR